MTLKKRHINKNDGILIVSVLFVILLSFIGLTLLTHSITHTRIQKARFKKSIALNHMYQELIHYLHNQREKIFAVNLNDYPIPETDYFNKDIFPDYKENPLTISNSFTYHTENNKLFEKIRISNSIEVGSAVNNYCIQARVFIDILSGKIPLTLFPLFINKKIEGSEETYLEENRVTIKGDTNFIISDISIEFHVSDFLIDSLKISGEILNWENFRKKFGLEIKNEPIAKGIYFIVEDDILESIFIQDDLQRMIFSTENGQQIIQFYIAGEFYELSYPPGQAGFFYWDNHIKNDSLFKEKIIVNGSVWSLEQQNDYAFNENSNITLFVSGKTIVRTSLKAEHIDIKKMNVPRLTLISSNNSLFNSLNQSEVVVDSSKETITEVSFITSGVFTNQSPDLKIKGSIFAKDLNNNGIVEISPQISNSDISDYFHTKNFKCVNNFLINHIEEVHDNEK